MDIEDLAILKHAYVSDDDSVTILWSFFDRTLCEPLNLLKEPVSHIMNCRVPHVIANNLDIVLDCRANESTLIEVSCALMDL